MKTNSTFKMSKSAKRFASLTKSGLARGEFLSMMKDAEATYNALCAKGEKFSMTYLVDVNGKRQKVAV